MGYVLQMQEAFIPHGNYKCKIEKNNSHNSYAYLNRDIVWNIKFHNNPIPEIEWHRFKADFQTRNKSNKVNNYKIDLNSTFVRLFTQTLRQYQVL